jgi:DmsE family decaheme c-type cytochrome
MNPRRVLTLVGALAILVSFLVLTSFGQESKKTEKGEYAGAEVCKECHGDLYEGFKKDNPHWRSIEDPKVPPGKKGCESCHGPGEKHAQAEGEGFIFSFKNKTAKDRADVCLKCHGNQKKFFQFDRSVHKLSAVACNDCHEVHATQVTQNLLKAPETDLCLSCHQDVKAKFYLPSRHKVLEGAVKCTDCHTPHGTRTRANLRKWSKFGYDTCFQCHPEKRGPWVFEHLAVKTEGCSICHSVHGSPNRFLLIRRDVQSLCFECHGVRHFPTISCINCHSQIHGSNFSGRFFQ